MTHLATTLPRRSALTRGYAIALVAAVFLSTTAVFIRYLTQNYQMPALVLAFWRDALAVVTLWPALRLFRPDLLRVEGAQRLYLILYGLLLAVFNALWTLSVALNGAAISTVLAYSSTGFTVLLGRLLLKEGLNWARLLAVTLCLGGCALVSEALDPAAWQANLAGLLAGILTGLSYAGYTLMGRSASQRGLDPWTTLLYTFTFATIFLFLINCLPAEILPGVAARPTDFVALGDALAGWAVLFLLAAGPTVLGFGLYNVSLSYLPSSVANLILTLEPASTALIAYILLGERLSGPQILGSLLILGGVAFLRIYEGWTAGRGDSAAPR
jgi:drug/metabolite transporter (DMT)-like permease